MKTTNLKKYDPHLLYHAINITVELRYKVPMQKVYEIIEAAEEHNKNSDDKITSNDIIELLENLGSALESSVLTDEPSEEDTLQSKIKELLRLLGCVLSEQELNKILRGEMTIEEALSTKAQLAWKLIFKKDEKGRSRPDQDLVNLLMFCTQEIAIENVELKIQRVLENYKLENKRHMQEGVLLKSDNMKTLYRANKIQYDPAELDKKRVKLKLYIAHMQGYDRDRDRDGSRGIDMSTGEIIDFGDIFIADKEHGSFIDDRANDGIDRADIK